MDGLGIAFTVGIVIFGVVGMLIQNQQRQARLDALRAIAGQLNWKFDSEDFNNEANRLAGFHVGSIGRSLSVTNMMSGIFEGLPVKVFDFSYVVPGGKNSHTVHQTVVELPLEGEKRPNFFLRPERAWWNRSLFESYRDFDFESHPQFSQRYQLSGNDEDAVRELFIPNVLEFFEQHAGLFVEGSGGRLIYHREGILVEPHEISTFVDEAKCCLRLLENSSNKSSNS